MTTTTTRRDIEADALASFQADTRDHTMTVAG